MGWGKLSGLLGLKAIVLACFLTPVSVPFVPTPAYAQFQIIIPGFGYRPYRQRYRGPRYRGPRRGSARPSGGQPSEQQIVPKSPRIRPSTE